MCENIFNSFREIEVLVKLLKIIMQRKSKSAQSASLPHFSIFPKSML